jgi:type I restriction enzyme S subunit
LTIGNIAFYNNEKIILGKSACYLNLNQDINKTFIFSLLQTSRITQYFDKQVTGSTIKNLSLSTIKETIIFLPSNQEQNRISHFFEKLDKDIYLLEKIFLKMCQQKKGLMQQLLTGKIRVKVD